MNTFIIGSISFVAAFIISTLVLRRVVPTNEVHIVQSCKATKSYGKDTGNGNVYYEWPTRMPLIGITKSMLPTSVFKLELANYDAYDKDRLPFEIDLVAFFRITDPNMAAQRVSSIKDLNDQLLFILRGAARTTLASYDINTIMVERSKFGDHFTGEVKEQLKQWGVETVKNIELMDIRDTEGSKVINNIMAKTKSQIEMESRTMVASNMKSAQVAETLAQQEVDVQKQVAAETVGKRAAEKDKAVGIATQVSNQEIKEQERITQEKHMAIVKVAEVQQAEINKSVKLVLAEQEKQTTILAAEADQQKLVLAAEGNFALTKRNAEGIALVGKAKAEAETALQLAPVTAQTTLAKEIGGNDGYQQYLVTVRQIEASQVIGIEQAKALEKADIKIIANSGDPVSGLRGVSDLVSAKGGTSLASMLEGLAQSEQGKKLIDKFLPPAAPIGDA